MDGMHVLTRAGGDIGDAAHNSGLANLSRPPGKRECHPGHRETLMCEILPLILL